MNSQRSSSGYWWYSGQLVGRMSGEGECAISGSSITETLGESAISWPPAFLSCLKSLTSFTKVGLWVGLVVQQAFSISCKPWVLNRELSGSGGRPSSSAGKWVRNLTVWWKRGIHELKTKWRTESSLLRGHGSRPIVKISTQQIEKAQTSLSWLNWLWLPAISSGDCHRSVPSKEKKKGGSMLGIRTLKLKKKKEHTS